MQTASSIDFHLHKIHCKKFKFVEDVHEAFYISWLHHREHGSLESVSKFIFFGFSATGFYISNSLIILFLQESNSNAPSDEKS